MANILGLMGHVQQQGELGKQQGQQSRLASLASQAYTTPAAQQNSLLGQMAQVSPEFAQGQQKQFQQQGDDRARKAAGAAKYVLSAVERGDPAAIQGAYRTVYPYLAELVAEGGGQVPPEQWDPAMAEGLHQILAAAEGGGANSRVQSRFVGEDGMVYAMMSDSPVPIATGIKADRQMWFRDHPGMAAPQLVGKDGQVQTVGQQSAPQGVPQSDGLTQFTDVNGRPVNFDAGVPANFREQMLANPEPFDSAPSGSTANLPHSIRTGQQQSMGGGVYARPSEAQTAAEVERAKLQAQLGFLPQRGQIEAQNAGLKKAAEMGVDRTQKAAADLPRITQNASEMIGVIDKLLTHPGKKMATGLSSKIDPRNFVPGQPGYDFGVAMDQIKGKVFLQAFETLKGGGQITEVEGEKATAAIARLNTAQSEGEFDAALSELREIVVNAVRRAERAAGGQPAAEQSTGGPQPGTVEDGYRFRGGDPADPNNWERT